MQQAVGFVGSLVCNLRPVVQLSRLFVGIEHVGIMCGIIDVARLRLCWYLLV